MSLLTESMEACTMIDRTSAPDGYGGLDYTWTPGATFMAAIVLDNSTQAKIAAVQGVTALYTVTTRKNINLQYRDVFRRDSDGQIFRVTSDGDDRKTPASAGLNMRQVSAEKWKLTTGKETNDGQSPNP